MEAIVTSILVLVAVIVVVFLFAPRPRLDATLPPSQVPDSLDPEALENWLAGFEADNTAVITGAEAHIAWADGPRTTDLCFLYVHGFSATRQEIAPVTERIANHFHSNVVYTRLAGHGLAENAMQATAEDWLQSMVDSWHIASRIGRKVVIVATSTGAPLSIWLNEHIARQDQVYAFIFLSPNFSIRNPFGFLLTWPWAERWAPWLLGKEHSWEPENELVAKYWSHRYSVQAIIEMQKIVDWSARLKPGPKRQPLATFYMKDDPTIDYKAAIRFHQRWNSDRKELHEVADDGAPQHVFVGDISAPHRNDWCVDTSIRFLESLRRA